MTLAAIEPDWPVPACVRARVSTRAGGVSTGAYASLNVATHTGDAATAVAVNRQRLIEGLDLPSEPHWLEQVHGTGVVVLDGRRSARTADAAVTREVGVVCCVQTADCLPILLADRAGTVVACAHAGWRGLAAGVVEATVAAMRVEAAALVAWLGPAISAQAYEVGTEVRAGYLARDARAAAAFAPNANGRWQADLYALARQALERSRVGAVYGGDFCTFADSERFFSHRRTAPCGRMAALIWLAPAGASS